MSRLADSGVGRRVTPVGWIRRGAAAPTKPNPPPDPVRSAAEKQAAACQRELRDNMPRRVAAHRHRVCRENANDKARDQHQPERHAGSIARATMAPPTHARPWSTCPRERMGRMTTASSATASSTGHGAEIITPGHRTGRPSNSMSAPLPSVERGSRVCRRGVAGRGAATANGRGLNVTPAAGAAGCLGTARGATLRARTRRCARQPPRP